MLRWLRSYRIGSLFGFPIEVNLSFLIMLGVVLLMWGGLSGVFMVLIAFASVLLHELGHALTARQLGVPVAGIELHFFGGAAKMVGQPRTASDEVLIAAAGPAVSFLLGLAGVVMGALTGALGLGLLSDVFRLLGWINMVIGVFNLLPALPMDGGRILRALLTRKYPFERATDISVRLARGFAIALGVTGLFTAQLYLVLLAGLLWLMSANERRMARLMGHHFTYDRQGYRRYDHIDADAMPWEYGDAYGGNSYGGYGAGAREPGIQSFGWPSMGARRPGSQPFSFGGFVIRRRNGRLVIEYLD